MTVKKRILLSLAWLVFCVLFGFAAIAYVVNDSPSRIQANQRAGMLGTGLGVVVGIGWAGLWLPYAAAIGKKRREEQARAKRKKKKRR